MSQHLVLEYWLCTEGECANVDNNSPVAGVMTTGQGQGQVRSGGRGRGRGGRGGAGAQGLVMVAEEQEEEGEDGDAPVLPNGAIFNRKDLYTQHVRRMHLPSHLAHLGKSVTSSSSQPGGPSNKKPNHMNNNNQRDNTTAVQELNTYITTLQSRSLIKRCSLPTFMLCPVASCTHPPFKGTEAWDQRMEHVAKHLECFAASAASATTSSSSHSHSQAERHGDGKADEEEEDKVEFGGENDKTLTEWAANPAVGIIRRVKGGKWVSRDPIKRRGHGGHGNGNGNGTSQGCCGVGRGGRARAVRAVKAASKAVKSLKPAKGSTKRKREEDEDDEEEDYVKVKQEIVVSDTQQMFDFDEGDLDFGLAEE